MKQRDLDTLEAPVPGGKWMEIEFGQGTLEVDGLQSYRIVLTQLSPPSAAYFYRRVNQSSEEFMVRGTAYADGTVADHYSLPVLLDPNFTLPDPVIILMSPPDPDLAQVCLPRL